MGSFDGKRDTVSVAEVGKTGIERSVGFEGFGTLFGSDNRATAIT